MHRRRICSRIRGRRRRKTILPDGLDDNRMVGNLEWVENQAGNNINGGDAGWRQEKHFYRS